MLDVLPPAVPEGLSRRNGNSTDKRRARPIQHLTSAKPRAAMLPASQSPIQMAWKLPARLRKPIREQLAKERQQKKQREAIVRFERRPLNTQIVGNPLKKIAPPQNRGAEYHTGDVYTTSRPLSRVSLPPYAGSFARRLTSKSAPKVQRSRPAPVQSQKLSPSSRISQRPTVTSTTRKPVSMGMPRKVSVPPFTFERDVPYAIGAHHVPIEQEYVEPVSEVIREPVIEQPKRMFALPFSFSFWPTSLFSSKKKVHSRPISSEREPSRVKSLLFLLVGCLLAIGLMWNLQGVGRGVAVLGSVEGQAKAAYAKLLAAQAAFAATDFASGETELKDAGELLTSARSDLNQALSSTQYVLRALDVTGTVKSGDELLAAGEQLTDAGQFISRGAAAFFDVNLLGTQEGGPVKPNTLIDALLYAQQEFEPAIISLKDAERSLDNVGSPLLPSSVQEQVGILQKTVPRVRAFLEGWHEHSDMMLDLLGKDHQRQYLLLFANNDELRPVGGFIGTLGLVNVDNGRVENIDITSVYDPDGQLKEFIAPPDPLLPIVDRWYLRDANWFVDYPTSAKKIAAFFEKEGGSTVDGVILLTPEVVKRLIAISGPIEVPSYDQTLTAENFEQITQDEVTYSYDKELNKPKQFLADATPILLNRLFGQSQTYGDVLQALAVSLQQKDLLLYFRDAAAQERLVEAGWAGSLPPNQQGFLLVNNANIGGHKSDQFIDQEIDYRVEVDSGGQATAVVTIRRTHLGPEEGKKFSYLGVQSPADKDNVIYQRVLVPYGSQLLEAKGYTPPETIVKQITRSEDVRVIADDEVAAWQTSQVRDPSGTVIGQESGYTFFANWVVTKPGQTTVSLYRYALPEKFELPGVVTSAQKASLMVSKQPGSQRTSIRASLKLPSGARIVHTVPQSGVTQETDNEIVYRGNVSTDIIVGSVFTGR